MELKKNPKADVRRNSSLYFAVGLALVLLLTNLAINYKTYIKKEIIADTLEVLEEIEEEIPIVMELLAPPPPPPPPPSIPEEIQVVEDEVEIEETVIESTETEEDEEIVEIEDIEYSDEAPVEDVVVPFSIIENVPVFPGCEKKKNNAERKKCMSEKVTRFVNKKFNTDIASDYGLEGRMRVMVMFKIDKKGNVTGVQARGPHPALENEAKRVISLLPDMQPGKQRGKPVSISYSLPIVFDVQ
jgi:periplasmic protein TonB